MRLIYVLCSLPIIGLLAIILATNVFRPAPASERLAGVSVLVAGYAVDDLPNDKHRLRLTVNLSSASDIDQCVGFTLDEPFASRRFRSADGACPLATLGKHDVSLVFDGLTNDDLEFPSHTLVWGIPGGRCGPILTVFGVCVVEQAGTAPVELPNRHPLPSFGGFGSFGPLGPFFSFPPP